MGIINRSSFAKDLFPGVKKWYGLKYAEHPQEYLALFEKNSDDKAFVEEVGMVGFGMAQVKTEGSGIAYDEAQQGYVSRYTHTAYALGFIITEEMLDDGIAIPTAMRRAQALAFSMRQTKETVGANVYNRAFTSTYSFADGLELCSELHPNISGGTWRNELDVAADLSEASLEQACIDIGAFTNDRGMKIAVMPRKLIIPTALEFNAARILKSINQSGTANNDINAIRETSKLPEGYAVNHYLTDADAWFIRTNCPDGMKYFERKADAFDMDNDFDTSNAKFKASARYSFGCTDPRGIFGSPGA